MFLHIVLAFLAFFGLFFAVVITVKVREVRAAGRWPSVPGEIVSAKSSAKEVTTHHATEDETEDQTDIRNFARITYRYTVGNKEYHCSRLSIGEDLGNDDVEGKLQRYPKGATVEVFYDPARPSKAVLERGLPNGCAKAVMVVVALIAGIIGFFGYGLDYAVARIAPHMGHSQDASMVVFAGTFSLLSTWFTAALWYQGWVASRWPRVDGRIEPMENPTWRTPIAYHYKVNGVSYRSNVVDFGMNKRSVFKLKSGVIIRGGVPGQSVEVLYDPADPSKACLYPGSRTIWLPIVVALSTAGLAWLIATH